MNDITNILLRHNYVEIPYGCEIPSQEEIATILMNVSYYGYALSVGAFDALTKLSKNDLAVWWKNLEENLKLITGDSRKIDTFVVYKNFPSEVLEKTEAEYWIPQILMYWGFPSVFFTEKPLPREDMIEARRAIVLKRSKKETLGDILSSYCKSPARWKEQEFTDVVCLSSRCQISVDKIVFKENLVKLASSFMGSGKKILVATATDVLRLAVGLSDGDVSLREDSKFISFKKHVRRYLLSLLENCSNLGEDMARRPEIWKRFLHHLHPGDYGRRYPNVCRVMDDLYHGRLVTFNSRIEALLQAGDSEVLQILSSRPGEFRRRLAHTLRLFGKRAADAFIEKDVLSKLTTAQVVTLRAYLDTANVRTNRVFPPKGNWNKLQLGEVRWLEESYVEKISNALGDVLKLRLPKVKYLDESTKMIKLPNNGEVSYTRGTSFVIPDEVEFIRTASYWKTNPTKGTVWFDNGWNFFDDEWKSLGACCWNAYSFNKGAAIFSGDPVNSKEMEGRAAQLIDLYPSQLLKSGVRYAVWNILCYSKVAFADAEDVFAALQWGKDAQKGKLFEPSRCQLSFALTGKQMTKYICLIDLKHRKMVYLDANLHGNVASALENSNSLEKNMPPFMEYLDSLPSIYDLFCESVDENGKAYIVYSDRDVDLQDVPAYVFKPENNLNKYVPVNVNTLLT